MTQAKVSVAHQGEGAKAMRCWRIHQPMAAITVISTPTAVAR